jgi:hypothetical protein
MNGWSHEDYLNAPYSMVLSIFQMLQEEAAANERRNRDIA